MRSVPRLLLALPAGAQDSRLDPADVEALTACVDYVVDRL